MLVRVRTHDFDRHNAAVRHGALDILKLNGCVMNMEVPEQDSIDLVQNACALRRGNVRDRYMACERMAL